MNIAAVRPVNFRSWGDPGWIEIPRGTLLLSGANGVGKSSLIDGILFALYGVGSDAGSLIQRGSDQGSFAVVVETDQGDLCVERTIRIKGNSASVSLRVTREDENLTAATVSETQAALQQALGVSREVLLASAFSTQHGGAAFTEAAPRDRKKIFASILNLGLWDVLHEDAKTDLRIATQDVDVAKAHLERLAGAGARLAEASQRIALAKRALLEATHNETQAEVEAERLATEAESAREARRQHAAAVEAEQRARADHARATQERASADDALASAKAAAANAPSVAEAQAYVSQTQLDLEIAENTHREQTEAITKWREQVAEAKREIGNEQTKLAVALQAIERHKAAIAAETAGECSRCGAPESAWKTSPLAAAREALAEARSAESDAREGLEAWTTRNDYLGQRPPAMPDDAKLEAARHMAQAARSARTAAETTQALAGSVEAAQQRARDAADRQTETASALRVATARFEDCTEAVEAWPASMEADHFIASQNLDQARRAHSTAAADLARAEEAAKQAEREAAEETEARERLAAAERDAAIAGVLAAGFGPTGTPALIIDSVLGDLAGEANRVLSELASPIRVDLRSQRVTQKGDVVDALDIIVQIDALEAPYETLSGGERTRVALALRAALTRLLASKRGARVRLLVCDEPSGLDAQGSDAFADVLQQFTRAGIFESCIVITHDERLSDRIDRVIRVEKDTAGVSRLVGSPVEEIA